MKIAGLLILGRLGGGTAAAQSGAAGFFNPLSASRDGIHLYGVSVFGDYFSGGIPFELPTAGILPTSSTPVVGGGSASLGWSRTRDGSSLAVSYTPSFYVSSDQSVFNYLNGAISLSGNRKLGQKWTVSASVSGQVSSLQQTYFAANAFGLAASLPTTFDSLAGAMLSGTFTDAQLASALTGAALSVGGLPHGAPLVRRRSGLSGGRRPPHPQSDRGGRPERSQIGRASCRERG